MMMMISIRRRVPEGVSRVIIQNQPPISGVLFHLTILRPFSSNNLASMCVSFIVQHIKRHFFFGVPTPLTKTFSAQKNGLVFPDYSQSVVIVGVLPVRVYICRSLARPISIIACKSPCICLTLRQF